MEAQALQERFKKSEFTAKDRYDYKWITYPESHFLKSELKEQGEELIVTYETGERTAFTKIRQEDVAQRLLILESVGELFSDTEKYAFELQPENLFYDDHGIVQAKRRDVIPDQKQRSEKDFVLEYKAVIGFSMQKKYQYEDFRQGGNELLGKEGICGEVKDLESVMEIQERLRGEYRRILENRKRTKLLIPIWTYRLTKGLAIVLGVLLLGLAGFSGYHFIVTEPYKNAVIGLSDAYVSSDYVLCIDSMKDIAVKDMGLYQKYMLANAYVRSENLNQEQKENILSAMTLNDSASKLEYWIYLGRKDTERAEDIALQLSDNQLLLYAYMKEKANIESDTELTGAEKSDRLDELTRKMDSLMEEYNTEDEE